MTVQDSIIIAWEKIDPQSTHFNEKIKSLSPILVHTYTQQELQFAKQHPTIAGNEFFLKPLAPFFAQSEIDWEYIEKEIEQIFQQFFAITDFSKFTKDQDSNFFVTAKDKMGNLLGAIQFLITPEYEAGHVKAGYFGILPSMQNCGLEKMLMHAIFNILPETKRIFLHTRTTNLAAINIYKALGFTSFEGKMPHWIDLEYYA